MRKIVSLILAIVMTLSSIAVATPAAFAASNPSDIAGHTCQASIERLDSYNALTSLVYQGRFSPDSLITRTDFKGVIERLLPGSTNGISGGTENLTMRTECDILYAAAKTRGLTVKWKDVTDEVMTRGRTCVIICIWIDSDPSLRGIVEANQQNPQFPYPSAPVNNGSAFVGPDGAWYDIADGYGQNLPAKDGFWHWPSERWYEYRTSANNVNHDSEYGYWSNGWWVTYSYYASAGNGSNDYPNNGYPNNGGHSGGCPFTDIYDGLYCYDACYWAWLNGYASGTSGTTFSPDRTCSKAEVLTFLWRANGSPKVSNSCPISGINPNSYYYDALCWAASKGMFGSDDSTDPARVDCTRATAVFYLWKAAGSPSVDTSRSFSDVPSSASYKSAVDWAVERGITSGTGNNKFSPYSVVTRGQVMTLIYRADGVR